jgi:hypothetical protein
VDFLIGTKTGPEVKLSPLMPCGITFNSFTDLKKPVEALRDAFPLDSQKAAIQANRAYFEAFLGNMTFGACEKSVCNLIGSSEILHIAADPNHFGFAIKKESDPDFTGAQIKCAMTERSCGSSPNEKVNTIFCQANSRNTKTFPYAYEESSHLETLTLKNEFLDLKYSHDIGQGLDSLNLKPLFLDFGMKFSEELATGRVDANFNFNLFGFEIQTPQWAMPPTNATIKDPNAAMLRGFVLHEKDFIQQEAPPEFSDWTYLVLSIDALSVLFCGYRTFQAVQKNLPNMNTGQKALIVGAAAVASTIFGAYAFLSHCPPGATAYMGKCYTWELLPFY